MKVVLLQPRDLTAEQKARWTELQQASDDAASPFFSAAFACAAARHCPHVEIAVLQEGGEDVGFFPFQRYHGRLARPVAWRMNDFQGGVFRRGLDFDVPELLRACNLLAWRFDHLPVTQHWFREGQFLFADSPYVDLGEGFSAYLTATLDRSSSRFRTILRKSRKLEREVGSLRFEFDTQEDQVFETLVAWKSRQLQRLRQRDPLQQPWVRGLLQELRTGRADTCCGAVSALYAGDQLVAAHFGVLNAQVLHWWITAYNADFDRYSPGGALLVRLLEHAAQRGIRRIDLGKGDEEYKRSFQSAATRLAEGSVSRGRLRRARDRIGYQFRHRFRSSWLHGTSQVTKRCLDAFLLRPSRQQGDSRSCGQ